MLVTACLLAICTNAQILTKDTKTPEELVKKVLLMPNSGINVKRVNYIGSKQSVAQFLTETQSMPVKQGIVLCTGKAKDVDGPNIKEGSGEAVFGRENKIFEPYATGETWDAAILEFDFYANTSQVSFEYVFGSEEYPEFVNKGVNDVFVFLISPKNSDKSKNIALVPNTNLPVSVDNINKYKNKQWFVENMPWRIYKKGDKGYETKKCAKTNDENIEYKNEQLELSYTCQYDGFTKLLTATADVKPYRLYTLTLAIADVGDNLYDSGVFIKSQSLKSSGDTVPVGKLISKETDIINNDSINLFAYNKQNNSINITINFDTNSHKIKTKYYSQLQKIARLIIRYFDIKVKIVGHTDETGTHEYNQKLSEKRAKAVYDFLISKNVNKQQLSWKGKGKTEPINIEDTKKSKIRNRRVEFVFTR